MLDIRKKRATHLRGQVARHAVCESSCSVGIRVQRRLLVGWRVEDCLRLGEFNQHEIIVVDYFGWICFSRMRGREIFGVRASIFLRGELFRTP